MEVQMPGTLRRLSRFTLSAFAALALVLVAGPASAQDATSGAITGVVTDASTGAPLAGVTVVAQGPQGEQGDITDDTGHYNIVSLPPGAYVVRMFYGNVKVERQNVTIFADKKIQVNVPMQTKAATSETYTITEKAPTVDVGSTKIGTTISKDFTNNVPVGRNFESVATVAPGAQADDNGVAFAGTTSFENNYVIDGINVTSIHLSQAAPQSQGSALNLDFVQEVEVITGGYNAEYGRATGGVVNVITKSGSNEFHGDAAFYYDPGSVRGKSPALTFPGQSISTEAANDPGDYRLDFFADIGGPIIKDRLWFYVGFEPIFTKTTTTRIVSKLVDNCTQSDGLQADQAQCQMTQGTPDGTQDFVNGKYATSELYRTNRSGNTSQFQWSGKINLLVTPDHTLEVAYFGAPNSVDLVRMTGTPFVGRDLGGSQDAVAHWVSKLFDKKWQLEASLSYHRERLFREAVDPLDGQLRTEYDTDPVKGTYNVPDRAGAGPSLSWFAKYEGANASKLMASCDSVTAPTTGNIVTNAMGQMVADPNSLGKVGAPADNPNSMLNIVCPASGYRVGGRGTWEDLIADRVGARLAGTNFLRGIGHHQIMYGYDFERNAFNDMRFRGSNDNDGEYFVIQRTPSGATGNTGKRLREYSWFYFDDLSSGVTGNSTANTAKYPIKRDANFNALHVGNDPMGAYQADLSQCFDTGLVPMQGGLPAAGTFCAQTQTLNHALFLRDSWSILPNLTLNLGLRWEAQKIQGNGNDWETPVLTDAPINITNNWAPRLGVIYDPTNEGKSKLYASFARFYESIPMDINNRSLGQEGYWINDFYLSNYAKAQTKDRTAAGGAPAMVSPASPDCVNNLLANNTTKCQYRSTLAFAGEQSLIVPSIQAMYNDEFIVGGEYEVIEDLAVGAYYTRRNLGQIIEDGSVDNAVHYYITNPGTAPTTDQLNTLHQHSATAKQLAMQDMASGKTQLANDYQYLAGELDTMADLMHFFGSFDKPTRDYNAFTLMARKRFSKNWLAQASYTYARTIGNYNGLYDPQIGQKDPNVTELYDLPDVLANRNGPLSGDIPHQFKLDGYYTFPLNADNGIVLGTSFRANSGIPRYFLGYNQIYASDIVYLIPASQAGRNDVVTNWDVQLAYQRQLPRKMQLQVFFSMYNVLNTSTVTNRDDDYTSSTAYTAPIVNGTMNDLRHLKTVDGSVAKPNTSYGLPTSYQAPLFTRFGLRLSF
jgi:hypothetical protein